MIFLEICGSGYKMKKMVVFCVVVEAISQREWDAVIHGQSSKECDWQRQVFAAAGNRNEKSVEYKQAL